MPGREGQSAASGITNCWRYSAEGAWAAQSLLGEPLAADRPRVAESLYGHHRFRWAQLTAAVLPSGQLVDVGADRAFWLPVQAFGEDLLGPHPSGEAPAESGLYRALTDYRSSEDSDAMAEAYGISRNHLMKVVNKLTRAGLVDASRGVNGGLALARPAVEITVGEVVRSTEDDLALVECFREDNQCVITPECELKRVFGRARAAFLATLDEQTISDLMVQRRKMASRLKVAY